MATYNQAKMHFKNPSGAKAITVQANEKLIITLEDFEGGERSFDLTVEMVGDNAQCQIIGRIQTTGKDHKKWRVSQIYNGKNQIGHVQLRGTAEDESFLEFDGGAVLSESSEGSDAEVTEKIMLFDQARGRALPILTVKTDKVASAGHGASIAPINKETLLYCQSKGIDRRTAQTMIKEGFLNLQEDPGSSNRKR
ncbi:MAG TPA: SufD family Fe-S cluster assembly protein [Candidatus Gracilibacteria bacterium]